MMMRFIIVAVFLFNTILTQNSLALNIPIPIERLAKPEGEGRYKGNNSYALANQTINDHKAVNGISLYFSLAYGAGLVVLIPSVIAQQTHCTFWGRQYNRAIDTKAIIISSSSDFENGTDPLVVTNKSKYFRKRTYKQSQKRFLKFYYKLAAEYYQYHQTDAPSAQAISEIIYEANGLGLLSAKSLMKEMERLDSSAPLRWIIITGQLEDRIDQVKAILKELEDSVSALQNELQENEIINDILEDQEAMSSNLVEKLYPKLQAKINAIEDFNFQNGDIKYNNGYERI